MPKGVESIKYEGVSFNKGHIAKMSLAEFQEHEAHHGLSEAQLKEAWQLARGTKDVEDVSKGEVDGATVMQAEANKIAPSKGNKPR